MKLPLQTKRRIFPINTNDPANSREYAQHYCPESVRAALFPVYRVRAEYEVLYEVRVSGEPGAASFIDLLK